jgi:hypothetical protein
MPTGVSDFLTAVKDLLQGDGPMGQAVQRSVAPTIKAALSIAGPLVVQVDEALSYVKEIVPILKTLVDMYHEQGLLVKDYAELTHYLDQIQVYTNSLDICLELHARICRCCALFTSHQVSKASLL